MSSAAENDSVTLAFVGKLDNGTIFIEVTGENPLQVTLGQSELPPTVEMEIVGMQPGESKKIRVDPDEGFGPRLKDLLHEVPLKNFTDIIPAPGMLLSQTIERDGVEQQVPATIMEVTEEHVIIDYNHPLAGHHLTYELSVLQVDKR